MYRSLLGSRYCDVDMIREMETAKKGERLNDGRDKNGDFTMGWILARSQILTSNAG